MPKKLLNTDQKIEKLNHYTKLAQEALDSDDFVTRLGAIVIYAGLSDFYAVQSARVLEQVILKAQLKEAKQSSFQPREDDYFYDTQVPSRRIVKEIKRHLPFGPSGEATQEKVDEVNEATTAYLKSLGKFLSYRNTVVHHLGNPKIGTDDFAEVCAKTIRQFHDCTERHNQFMTSIQPFTFSQEEKDYFYGPSIA